MDTFEKNTLETLEERINTLQEGMQDMTTEQLAYFMNAFSGRNEGGVPKAAMSFMSYDINAPEEDPDKNSICTLTDAVMRLTIDLSMPMFYVFDVIFRNYDDLELRKLWDSLETFRRRQAENPEKVYAFYINLVQADSTLDTEGNLLACDIVNPLLFYLTREKPTTLARDEVREDGDLQGGNVVRMLVPVDFVSFRVEEGISISELQAEVQREDYEREYAFHQATDGGFTWKE